MLTQIVSSKAVKDKILSSFIGGGVQTIILIVCLSWKLRIRILLKNVFFSVFYDRYMKIEHMIRWLLFFFLSIDQFQYIGVRRYIKCRRRLILLILLYQSSSRVEAILQPYIHLCHYVKFELMIHVKLTKTKRSVNHPGLSSSHRPSICKRQIFDILTRLTGTISSKLVKKLT